ncbi:hypothetical protein, partial [Microbulbifer discodermiae]|uniref:hypothetical protein n=1 Tax=Microbulbifer sp. 2201CG32-9 TaxID=3232309 RepID=UPI00345C1D1D
PQVQQYADYRDTGEWGDAGPLESALAQAIQQSLAGTRLAGLNAQPIKAPDTTAQVANTAALQTGLAKGVMDSADGSLHERPQLLGFGKINPRDFTSESLAEYQQTGDLNELVRYSEFSQGGTRYGPSADGGVAPLVSDLQALSDADLQAEIDKRRAYAQSMGRAAGSAVIGAEERAAQNKVALSTYEMAVKGLRESMQNTTTGPVAGRIPAMTPEAQIAEGAAAAMAPVLKSIFRVSGEGTFTDRDQALLMEMLPSRKDHSEAAQAKLNIVDAIVGAKLGGDMRPVEDIWGEASGTQSTGSTNEALPLTSGENAFNQPLPPVNAQGWQLMIDGSGNRAYIGPNGEVEEI